MGEGKQLSIVLLTRYNNRVVDLIDSLLAEGVHLSSVIFAPTKTQRLGFRTYARNLLTSGRLKDPRLFLKKHRIPYTFVKSHNSESTREYMQSLSPDLFLLYGTNIIKEPVLNIPRIGTLNAHSSLLPKYRGAASEFWMFLHGETQYAGITVHWVDPGLDTGDMITQEPLSVSKKDTPRTLRAKGVPLAGRLFAKAIKEIEQGVITRIAQNEEEATSFKRPTDEDRKKYEQRYGSY